MGPGLYQRGAMFQPHLYIFPTVLALFDVALLNSYTILLLFIISHLHMFTNVLLKTPDVMDKLFTAVEIKIL